MGHYTPLWFGIRQSRPCSSGAASLYRSVEPLREPPPDLQQTVRPVSQRTAFWAQPEQLLPVPACTTSLHRSVEPLREQPPDLQQTVRPVSQRNAFWAQPEQLLLAMVADPDQSLREPAEQQESRGRRTSAPSACQRTVGIYPTLARGNLE